MIVALFLVSLLVIISVSDIAYMVIPDKVLAFFLLLFAAVRLFHPLDPWWDSLLGAVTGFGILFLLAIISKGGMGGGDIKLFFVLGVVLGVKKTVFTLFFASFTGALFGIIRILLKGYQKRNPIPFGPFISIGAIFAYFYTDAVLYWYFRTFLDL